MSRHLLYAEPIEIWWHGRRVWTRHLRTIPEHNALVVMHPDDGHEVVIHEDKRVK